nr:hypothetical protein [Nonomuraea sp. SYSU D8015]
MSHPLHEVGEARGGAGGDRVAGVSEIVGVQARKADLPGVLVPLGRSPEVAAAKEFASCAGEDQRVGLGAGELVE